MDAADGAVGSGPLNEDLSKLLKKLGYPEIHDNAKPSALMEKAIQACTKRLKKLWEMLPTRETEKNDADEKEPPKPAVPLQNCKKRLVVSIQCSVNEAYIVLL